MAERITAPINYPVIAGGKIVKGGSVVFGEENVKPDPDNISTLKPVYLDSLLSAQADNPQGLSSDGVFDQSDTGILFGADGDKYSILVLDQNGVELSYIASYDLSDASAAATAQQSASDAQVAQSAAESAQSAAQSALNEFQNQYWGAYASEPSLSPVGDPPTGGDLYFNTTSSILFVYSSNESVWKKSTSAVNGIRSEGSFTNVAGQDTFAFNYDPNYVDVFYNGQRLQKAIDFDGTSGTQIVLTNPVSASTDRITIVAFNNVDFADLGTAASRDVQTSPTDTTDGRLMAVGAFGIGDDTMNFQSAADGKTYVNTGFFYGTFTDAPSGLTTTACFLHVAGADASSGGGRARQILRPVNSGAIYERIRYNGLWSDWQPVYTGANYQPETISSGLGVVKICKNITGAIASPGQIVAGTSLREMFVDNTGTVSFLAGATLVGSWKMVLDSAITNNAACNFVRIA